MSELNLRVDSRELLGLIGPNGAGKTTVFNLITGVYAPTRGTIDLEERSLVGLKTYEIASLGIARTFQNIRLFAFMSALDNVMTGEHSRMRANLFGSLLHIPSERRE